MSETWSERIIEALRLSRLPLDDDELARRLGASQRQTINQTCRRLESAGAVERYVGPEGKIVNRLVDNELPAPATRPRQALTPRTGASTGLITEDEVKSAVKSHLERDGWVVTVAWGREHGVDIRASRGSEMLLVEAKGEAANPPQQVNYFLGALGELIRRMSSATATYGLALPDNKQYRGLVARLPPLARDRLDLAVFFVDELANVLRG